MIDEETGESLGRFREIAPVRQLLLDNPRRNLKPVAVETLGHSRLDLTGRWVCDEQKGLW